MTTRQGTTYDRRTVHPGAQGRTASQSSSRTKEQPYHYSPTNKMQLSSFFGVLALVAMAMLPLASACSLEQDCCWGGVSSDAYVYGDAGCRNQHRKHSCANNPVLKSQACGNNGVSEQECNADCCSITLKVGRGCP
ncbi:hypothetical protein EJ03DRAFT_57417 [Teratosphaeria nubilosa]|uniref:Uncharacterized protein n=1 Tax=Teratosphaeria nubilosa TaxID=161662 RepID=A0A6G1KUB7_9PEZI|nr:hypothetical protein EJ03DRAFT_57417 [Teratosphaeria nubilosa]